MNYSTQPGKRKVPHLLPSEYGCSMLFIAHDLSMVEYLCHRVGVMYHGKLVEVAPTEEL